MEFGKEQKLPIILYKKTPDKKYYYVVVDTCEAAIIASLITK